MVGDSTPIPHETGSPTAALDLPKVPGEIRHYTPTAILFEPGIQPIQTRDSIRAFIASFPGVRVEVATATPDTIEIWGRMALLWGSYFERLGFPGQPLSEQHGKFVAQWARQADGTWLIQRLFRIPVPSPPSSRAP
jgi:ketosteroid isomerase-like protein